MADIGTKPEPLEISRIFPVPREILFRAWSSAAHIKRWFCPADCTVPEAEIAFHPGGAFNVCMKLPDGSLHWTRGKFTGITAPERLSFESAVSSEGTVLFNVHTLVRFTEENNGTRMNVRQDYEILHGSAQYAIGGATEGWRTTLDRLAKLATQLTTPAVHGSFTIERMFTAPPARVFHALTNAEAKAKWFAGGHGQEILERRIDATPGGRERVEGRWPDGTISCFDALYFDVTPDRRLVYAYEMHITGVKISVSLATLELSPVPGGTRLVLTEQGSFLDGYEDNGAREEGTGFLLTRLAASLGEPGTVTPPEQICGQS